MLWKQAYLGIPLLLLLFVRFFFFFQDQPVYSDGQEVLLSGMLAQEPQIQGNRQSFQFQGVWLTTSSENKYHYGDSVEIKGKVSCKESEQNDRVKRGFAEKCVARLYFPEISLKQTATSPIFQTLSSFRQFVSAKIKHVLPSDLAALFIGIIFGSKEGFSAGFKTGLQNTGTLHVVAASGMNVTLLIGFLLPVFMYFVNRRVAAMLVIAVVILYAILAQLSASIVRASLMGILTLVGFTIGRQTHAGYFLLVAAVAMVGLSPSIIFDIGFQLSFMATLGLVYGKPILDRKILKQVQDDRKGKEKKWYKGFLDDFTTTLAAQLATLPILLANFGVFSLVSVFVNAIVLWTVPILMVLGFVFAAIAFIPVISEILLYIALPLLLFFKEVIMLFSQPIFVLKIEGFSLWFGIGYYLLLLAIYYSFRSKNQAAT